MDIRGDLGYARQGGGIYTDKSNPTVTNLKIVRNKADFGAGIASYISGPMISDTVISDNIATTWGGGIYYSHSTYTDLEKNIVLKNTVVSKNKASGGAGITVNYGSQPILTNVTISENILVSDNPDRVKNDGNNGGAIWRGNKSGVIMSKSIIWNNSSTQIYWAGGDRWTSKISHSDIQGGESGSLITWGDGNIDSDPLFVDARNGDYRLSKNSPAKNMGAYPDTAGTGIPTLSEWGLIIFMLMLTTIGILFTMRRQAMIAATSGGIADGTPPPVLVPAVFIKALTITGLLALIGFAISIWLSSSLPTTTDIVGTLISVPIFAYLIHLLMIFKRQ
jgi:parallel beta-helix repeat protein